MSLSRRSVETLLDLVENKLTSMQVIDRDDARELAILENARRELCSAGGKRQAQVLPFAAPARRQSSPVTA
ncbi:MAG: hypothetical protein HY057_01015 [Rhodospirillales bacterium]|nr:hypothetical protein [Rhodospirillales bacterium]